MPTDQNYSSVCLVYYVSVQAILQLSLRSLSRTDSKCRACYGRYLEAIADAATCLTWSPLGNRVEENTAAIVAALQKLCFAIVSPGIAVLVRFSDPTQEII